MTTLLPTLDAGRDRVIEVRRADGPTSNAGVTIQIRWGSRDIASRHRSARSIWQSQAWY